MRASPSLTAGDVWALFDIASLVDQEGLGAYLERMIDQIAAWFRATGASVFLSQADGRTFLIAGSTGAQTSIPSDARVFRGVGIAGEAIVRGRPMLIQDPADDAVLCSMGVQRRPDIETSMVLPLISGPDGCIGVLNLSRGTGSTPFTKRDLARAAALGRQIALAVLNARLFARTNAMIAEGRALHETVRSVIESVGVGILVVSASGAVTECNPEATAFLGRQAAPTDYWENAVDLLPEPYREEFRTSVERALEGADDRRRLEDPVTERAWSVSSKPLVTGGATIAIHELTEDERQQRELQRIQRLAEIGQMTATIAHEIRNPLTGICSAARIVQQEADHALEFGKIIETEALKLNDLCDEFLEFARPLQLRPAPAKLGEIVGRVVDLAQGEFAAAQVRLRYHGPTEDPTLMLDASRVEQVVRNLLRNALEATPPGSEVGVWVEDGKLTVADNGPGMEAEVLNRLFTPFYTTKAHGSGLGLSTVRKILDQHGGRIVVRSAPGEGATFTAVFTHRTAA